jgi:transposase
VLVARFIPFDPNQPLLLPPDLRDALPVGHPALLVGDLVDQLDLSEIEGALPDERLGGAPAFDPRLLLRVWIYAYLTGVRSSRKLAQAIVESVPFRVLAHNTTPGYWALNRFRTRHRVALGNLLVQTVQLASDLGLVKLAGVAIDGTKIKANASKHKAMSYARMDAREAKLRAEVEAYLRSVDERDEDDDRTLGPDDDGMSLPPELRDVQARRQKIAEAKRELERRARERAAREQTKRAAAAEREGRTYAPRQRSEDAVPRGSDQINFTDPESRIMQRSGAFVQAYNAQAAVDVDTHVVVAALVTNQPVDVEQLPALADQTIRNAGRTPERFAADTGYYSERNVQHVQDLGAEALIPPEKVRHSVWREQVAPTGRIPANLSPADRMRRRLATKTGKRLYLQRQASVEPVFGTTRGARGLQQFHHRGLEKNHHLWRFDLAVHNLMKIIGHLRAGLPRTRPPGAIRGSRHPTATAGSPA